MEQWSVPAAVCERVREDRERGAIVSGEIAREERSPLAKGEIAREERAAERSENAWFGNWDLGVEILGLSSVVYPINQRIRLLLLISNGPGYLQV
jgi:hypothetical protein